MPTTTSPTLRLHLGDGLQSGRVDGAWWPRTRDLRTEAADLVDHFPADVGRIARLLLSLPDWDDAAGVRRVDVARGQVKVGSFPKDDTHLMVAVLFTGQRLRLLVVPSDTDPAVAERMIAEASDAAGVRTAEEILAG